MLSPKHSMVARISIPVVLAIVLLVIVASTTPSIRAQDVESGKVWLQNFCMHDETCMSGDFDGDGKTDVIAFVGNTSADRRGSVFVSLSTGSSFDEPREWMTDFCVDATACLVGDFNRDNLDDILAVMPQRDDSEQHLVVALSDGSAFGEIHGWGSLDCHENCQVADVNGDNADDLVVLGREEILVSISRTNAFGPEKIWLESGCEEYRQCVLGDANGDSRSDLIKIASTDDIDAGAVTVNLSDGGSFTQPAQWHDEFCGEPDAFCLVADFNGDSQIDLASFITGIDSAGSDETILVTHVDIALSTHIAFDNILQRFESLPCRATDHCHVGDFDGDGREDTVLFTGNSMPELGAGQVYVTVSSLQFVWEDDACSQTVPDDWEVYTLQSDEDLDSLAVQHGVSVKRIRAVNCLMTLQETWSGQSIWVPAPVSATPVATATLTFTPFPTVTPGPVTATTTPVPPPPPTRVPSTQVPPTRVPPTQVPPTQVLPTQVPPTQVPPTQAPPTQVPPTQVPPTTVAPPPTTAAPPPTATCAEGDETCGGGEVPN